MQRRATLLHQIRQFFYARKVLEVETPLLSQCSGTDPQLDFFTTTYSAPPVQQTLFLQTSPEFAMKRLLAAGCGSIYQITKAFRNGEAGRFHNPEFTLLEWYRVGFGFAQLMDEIEALITELFADTALLQATERVSYQAVFARHTGLNALVFDVSAYSAYALVHQLPEAISLCGDAHNLWLDFLFSHQVQPFLGVDGLCMVYGYPVCQSSLARINVDNPLVTDRVEIFINGVELGNGYFELTDALEQNHRFDQEIAVRTHEGLPAVTKDTRLLAALDAGLPMCSGMAIGLDRLLMLLMQCQAIDEVLCFSLHRA